MKNKLSLILILFCVMFTACINRDCCSPPPSNYIRASKNLAVWVKQDATFIAGTDSLTISGGTDDALMIKLKYTGVGKYTLSGTQVRYTITAANGKIGAIYVVDSTKENYIDLGLNADMKLASGTFSLNLIKAPGYDDVDNPYPVGMTFTNGTFLIELGK